MVCGKSEKKADEARVSSTAERWASQAAAISCRFSKAKVWSVDFILKVW